MDDLLRAHDIEYVDAMMSGTVSPAIQRRIVDTGLWLPLCNVRTVTSYRPDVLPGVHLDAEALARIP